MKTTIAIGAQNYADVRERGVFYIDKTDFIRQWWGNKDDVTLICRPRRFGKTLNMSMVECFFSTRFAGRKDLFEDLDVWEDASLRAEQGTWPVVALSFAGAKGTTYEEIRTRLCECIARAYRDYACELGGVETSPAEDQLLRGTRTCVSPLEAAVALTRLCELLYRATGKRAIVLLDEYDTPMQEAWLQGFWDEATGFVRSLFNNTFKTNPYLERALLTGVTRVSHESIFSDMNNPEIITTLSQKYASSFGFTEAEVFAAMDEMGFVDRAGVKSWYDGFTFGGVSDIYNPWSIIKYLSTGELGPHWANTSSNALVDVVLRDGGRGLKADFETLLQGGTVCQRLDEQVVFGELGRKPGAVWALLLANGYLRTVGRPNAEDGTYELALTNREVRVAFDDMVRGWFEAAGEDYGDFVASLLQGDLDAMNHYMNDVALETLSVFDTGTRPADNAPERFYHGFVLGLLVELRGRYRVRSNRESGFGRYDVMLEPCNPHRDDGIVIEFKVRDPHREASLDETVVAARAQIDEKQYASELVSRGVPVDRVRCYGFAFEGKRVLIG